MANPRLVLSAVTLLALAACHGAGSDSTLPATNNGSTTESTTSQTFAFPRTAPQGVRIYVHLPLRNSAQLDRLISEQSTKDSRLYHHWLTPAQFRAQYGPTLSSLQSVASILNAQGFKTEITSQSVIADAPQATVERTFNVRLSRRTAAMSRGTPVALLQANRAPTLPAALSAVGADVAAFAPLPAMRPDFTKTSAQPIPENQFGPDGGYFTDDLKEAYQYPAYQRANGSGRTIGIVAACDFLDSDMAAYFGFMQLPVPNIVRRPVDGGSPPLSLTNGNCFESSLDVQQAGGSAPGATLVVYEAPDASVVPSFLDIYTAIVEDNTTDVVNTSFGECELYFTAAYNGGQDFTYIIRNFHDVFRQGNAQGITFVNSSGDLGGLGCTDTGFTVATPGVEWSPDDPDVTGVGGTNLVTSFITGSLQSTYVRENANFDTFSASSGAPAGAVWGSGGGKSVIFSKPLYQFLVNTGSSMRTVPDVAMHMGGCPVGSVSPCGPDRSFDWAAVGGFFFGVIGTSASSPDFAGVQAIQDQLLGARTGNVNDLLYALAGFGSIGNGPIFHSDIPGNNGVYATQPGYNLVLGNGTPYVAQYDFDPFGPQAGNPQTPSNP